MKYIKRGKWQGFRQLGVAKISTEGRDTNMLRASWLTAMVESGGKFGCVINFDRTGITAGLHQAIAVYPKQIRKPDSNPHNDQGPLWRLLEEIRLDVPDLVLFDCLSENGIDASLSGPLILSRFAGSPDGKVPASGPRHLRSKRWVRRFHEAFTDPRTFAAQECFGISHFYRRATRAKLRFAKDPSYHGLTVADVFYRDEPVLDSNFEINPGLDLALCVYWSHSVNAPSMALKVLCDSSDWWRSYLDMSVWAKIFIKKIATTRYGRWHEDEKNGRYDRTRRYAMQSGFWPAELFDGPNAIMPKEF